MWFGPRLTRSQINRKVTAPPESPVMWPWRALWATLLLGPKIPGPSLASALCLASEGGSSLCPSEFKKTLEEAIRSDTSGHFQRLLISLSQVPFPRPLRAQGWRWWGMGGDLSQEGKEQGGGGTTPQSDPDHTACFLSGKQG